MKHISKSNKSMRRTARIVMILLSVFLMTGIAYAAGQTVTFGYYTNNEDTGNYAVTAANTIDCGTLDLSKIDMDDESTYTITRKVCIKGAKYSDLIIWGCGIRGDESGLFGVSSYQTHIVNNVPYLLAEIRLDASEMMPGTYTANLEMTVQAAGANGSYSPVDLVANNGALVGKGGVLQIPVTVRLTGTNAHLAGELGSLQARGRNDDVVLSWTASESAVSKGFNIYRREGAETAAPGNYDLSKYKLLEEYYSETSYTDTTARNGKTYSYFVIAGTNPSNCYPSNAAIATPSADIAKEPYPPILRSPDADTKAITLKWFLSDEGKNDLESIDYFNVYRNGVIVARIDQNAYAESVTDSWDEEQGKSVESHSYEWTARVESAPGVYCRWTVTAVSKEGVEGSESESYEAAVKTTEPTISGWSGYCTDYYKENDEAPYQRAICLKVNDASYYNAEFVTIERKTAGSAYQFLARVKYNAVYGNEVYDFADTDITAGTKYTYRMKVTDTKKQTSEPVEVSVEATPDYDGIDNRSVPFYYSINDKNQPVFDLFGQDGVKYSLYRVLDGSPVSIVETRTGSGSSIRFCDTDLRLLENGIYTYYIRAEQGDLASFSAIIKYRKDTALQTLAEKPGAPSLSARVTGYDRETIALKWNRSASGGAPDGYYVYKEISQPEYDEDGNQTGNYVRAFDTGRFHESDGYISNWWMSEYAQDRYIRLYADKKTLTDRISWNYEEQFPVKYYVCAYNQYGVSKPSEVITYEYDAGNAPSNGDAAAPGKPRISGLWTEPDSNTDPKFRMRRLHVTWEAPVAKAGTGGVDRYEIELQRKQGDGWEERRGETVYAGEACTCSFLLDGKADSEELGIYRAVLKAVNEAGDATVISDEIALLPLPEVSLTMEDLSAVQVSWTDPGDTDGNLAAADYSIFRRDEYGLWQAVSAGGEGITKKGDTFTFTDASGTGNELEAGTAYLYRVEAADASGSRLSDIQTITISVKSILPGAPTNLRAKRMTGDRYLLTWDKALTGGEPSSYKIQFGTIDGDEEEWSGTAFVVPGTTTSYADAFATRWIRILAVNEAGVSEASNWVDLEELPENEEEYYPHAIYPSVTCSGDTDTDPWVKLSWKKDTTSNWGEADYYAIYKLSPGDRIEQFVASVPAEDGKNDYEWSDTEVEAGEYYEYWLRASNVYGYNWVSDYSVWAEPGGTKETASQRAVRKVSALIEAIPNALDTNNPEHVKQVNQTSNLFDGLTDEQKAAVPQALRNKLQKAVDLIRNAQAKQDYYDAETGQLVTKPVQDAINALPDVYAITEASLEDAALLQKIRAARNAYDDLSKDAQRTVDDSKLTDIEKKLESLRKDAADQKAASAVKEKLEALPSVAEYDAADDEAAAAIANQADKARRALNGLLPRQRTMLAGMAGGQDAVDRLNALETAVAARPETDAEREEREEAERQTQVDAQVVTAKIDALYGDITEIGLDDEYAVNDARDAFDTLSSAAQAYVGNLDKLAAAEERIEALKAEAADIGAAEGVIALIDALPGADAVTMDNEADVLYARIAFEALSEEQKARIDMDKQKKLFDLLDRVTELRNALIPLANTEIRVSDMVYTGKDLKPLPVVTFGGAALTEGTDFTVVYANNKDVGPGTVIVIGKGNYYGDRTATFRINPKGTSVVKLKRVKKAFTVKWKKQGAKMSKSKVTGYQIQYGLKKNFAGAKTKTVRGAAKVSKKIGKLKAKKKYYIRVRTYMTTGGTTYYSKWSAAKKVKTK